MMHRQTIAAGLLAVLPLLGTGCGRDADTGVPAWSEIAGELGLHRPLPFRLSADLPYAPCREQADEGGRVPRWDCGLEKLQGEALARFSQLKLRAGRAGEGFEARHQREIWRLLDALLAGAATAESLQPSVKALEALARERDEAPPWNDLGVLYAAYAAAADEPRSLFLALDAFSQAAKLNPACRPAAFNRALLLDRLQLDDAGQAWSAVRELEGDGPWAAEAATRDAALAARAAMPARSPGAMEVREAVLSEDPRRVSQAVGRFPLAARELVERQLLPEWGKARLARRSSPALERARGVAVVLERRYGDRWTADLVAAVDRALRAGDPLLLDTLAHGSVEYAQARYGLGGQPAAALKTAGDRLRAAGSPLALSADFYQIFSRRKEGDDPESRKGFEALREEIGSRSYPSLSALVEWMLGQGRFSEGLVSEALSFYRRAEAGFRSAGEIENAATLRSLVGLCRSYQGDPRGAWRDGLEALRQRPLFGNPRRLHLLFLNLFDIALREEKLHLALSFNREVERYSQNDPERLTDALIWRGYTQALAGEPVALVVARLEEARRPLSRIVNETKRERFTADLETLGGSLLVESEPETALVRLSKALEIYDRSDVQVQTAVQARTLRAHLHRRRHRLDEAEEDLRKLIQRLEDRRRRGAPRDGSDAEESWADKRPVADRDAAAYREMISLQQVDRGRPEEAWHYAERERDAPFFREEPRRAGELVRYLPADVAVVQMAVLDDRVLIWRFGPRGVEPSFRRVKRKALEEEVRRFAASGWEGGGTLFGWLVKPWIGQVPAGMPIVIVPDGPLEGLAWAALADEKGRYLFEDHPLSTAPSASFVARSAGRSWPRAERPTALIVGNPALSGDPLEPLPDLTAAAGEAREVARLYPGSPPIVGAAATRGLFLDRLAEADLVFFAGHATADTLEPERSSLRLASGGQPATDGRITVEDLRALDLPRTRLVVLDACSAAVAGRLSLASGFLAAGSPAVVANLNDVRDQTTHDLYLRFYRALGRGKSPSAALREAQLSFLRNPDGSRRPPAEWAGVQVFGYGFLSP
jgi:hypothetical protein